MLKISPTDLIFTLRFLNNHSRYLYVFTFITLCIFNYMEQNALTVTNNVFFQDQWQGHNLYNLYQVGAVRLPIQTLNMYL